MKMKGLNFLHFAAGPQFPVRTMREITCTRPEPPSIVPQGKDQIESGPETCPIMPKDGRITVLVRHCYS